MIMFVTMGMWDERTANNLQQFLTCSQYNFPQQNKEIDMKQHTWIDVNILWVVNTTLDRISNKLFKTHQPYKKMVLKIKWVVGMCLIQEIINVLMQYGPDPILPPAAVEKNEKLVDILHFNKFRGVMEVILYGYSQYVYEFSKRVLPYDFFPDRKFVKGGQLVGDWGEYYMPDDCCLSVLMDQIYTSQEKFWTSDLELEHTRLGLKEKPHDQKVPFKKKKKRKRGDEELEEEEEEEEEPDSEPEAPSPKKSKKDVLLDMLEKISNSNSQMTVKCHCHRAKEFVLKLEFIADCTAEIQSMPTPVMQDTYEFGADSNGDEESKQDDDEQGSDEICIKFGKTIIS